MFASFVVSHAGLDRVQSEAGGPYPGLITAVITHTCVLHWNTTHASAHKHPVSFWEAAKLKDLCKYTNIHISFTTLTGKPFPCLLKSSPRHSHTLRSAFLAGLTAARHWHGGSGESASGSNIWLRLTLLAKRTVAPPAARLALLNKTPPSMHQRRRLLSLWGSTTRRMRSVKIYFSPKTTNIWTYIFITPTEELLFQVNTLAHVNNDFRVWRLPFVQDFNMLLSRPCEKSSI